MFCTRTLGKLVHLFQNNTCVLFVRCSLDKLNKHSYSEKLTFSKFCFSNFK